MTSLSVYAFLPMQMVLDVLLVFFVMESCHLSSWSVSSSQAGLDLAVGVVV